MVETKLFKTKLCVLYEKGRCTRHTCTFAHGDSELRRPRDGILYRDNDLRSKLDRKRSPLHRVVQGSNANKRFTPSLPSKRRKIRTHEHMGGPIDSSGGFRSPDGIADSTKDEKHAYLNSRTILDDELKQVQYEIDMLLNQNGHLETELEQRVQEADILSSRIRELEAQLSEEKDKSKRVNSQIKKFIKAHVCHSQLQDEIKRSQIQLDQLMGEIGITAVPIGEGKLNVNIISDEDVAGLSDNASPARKQLHINRETPEGLKSDKKASGNLTVAGSWRNSLLHLGGHQEAGKVDKRNDVARLSNESKPRKKNSTSKILDRVDKQQKPIELNLAVPPTSMAGHAVDDFVELAEEEENHEDLGNPASVEKVLPFLPPPPPIGSQNSYFQYQGDDENVDVDGYEEEFEEANSVNDS